MRLYKILMIKLLVSIKCHGEIIASSGYKVFINKLCMLKESIDIKVFDKIGS
jgi:hypothetical protein